MAKLTTSQAIRRLLTDEDYLLLWMRSGFTKDYRRKLRYKFNRNQLSLNLQEALLTQCGFLVAVEKSWQLVKR